MIKTIDNLAQDLELFCENIHIKGDAYKNSILDSNQLLIDGTTHQDSTQFSKYAKIHTHQGILRCHEANIDLLDGGEIHASNLIIETAQSGSIYAQNITIKNLTSNVQIYASHSINIESIHGEGNFLSIDYRNVPIIMSKIALIQEDIEELESVSDIKGLKNKIELQELKDALAEIKDSVKTAKISVTNTFKGSNSIKFVINDTKEIDFQTQNVRYTAFHLEFKDNTITLQPTQKTIQLNS